MPTFHVTIALQTEFRLMGDPGLFEGFVFDSSLPDGPVDLLHLSVEADDFPTADRIAVERATALVDGNALSLYRQALAARSALEEYLNFYRVLELCIGGTDKIEAWIKAKWPNISMVDSLTAITDMRNQVAHAKRNRAYAILSKVAHVNQVEALLVEVEALARKAIEESGES